MKTEDLDNKDIHWLRARVRSLEERHQATSKILCKTNEYRPLEDSLELRTGYLINLCKLYNISTQGLER